jgi:hypothetical protein
MLLKRRRKETAIESVDLLFIVELSDDHRNHSSTDLLNNNFLQYNKIKKDYKSAIRCRDRRSEGGCGVGASTSKAAFAVSPAWAVTRQRPEALRTGIYRGLACIKCRRFRIYIGIKNCYY